MVYRLTAPSSDAGIEHGGHLTATAVPDLQAPSAMVRVLLLSTDLQRGGLPLRLVAMARLLPDYGVRPIVGCLSGPGPLHDELRNAGVETFACGGRGRWDPRCLLRLAGEIRRRDPDLVHASLFHANLAARLVGAMDRRRPIITATVTIEIERPLHRWVEALTADRSDAHVANSRAVACHLVQELGMPERLVSVIPNGVDVGAFASAAPISRQDMGIALDASLIVWAGRMDPVKNLSFLVEVMERLRDRRRVVLVLLGDGPQRPALERTVRSRGLSGAVRLVGWSNNVAGWLRSADILVLPSRTEGSPNVVLQAMACGCAVIASDIPACRELIAPDETGRLVPAGAMAQWVEAIASLADDASLRTRLATAARQKVVASHELKKIVRRWADFYQSFL